MIINNSGGGASLNYKVVGGTTQPSSASENTIWVNTSTAITSHVFSATQPTSPSAGMVWFNIGVSCSAPINLLKKGNEVWLYPTAVQQYVSGAWVAKEAKTYQNGAWVDWSVTVFDRTAQDFNSISGNLHIVNDASVSPITDSAPFVKMASTSNHRAWQWDEPIDFSKYNVLEVTGYAESGKFGVAQSLKTTYGDIASVTEAASMDFETSNKVHTLDVSAVSGVGYIGFYTAANKSIYVKCVKLI